MEAVMIEAISSSEDPFSDENLLDPYPLHERLREAGPVLWLEKYGAYALARFELVQEVLMDFEAYISGAGLGPTDTRQDERWREAGILESDPPTHTVMRRGLSHVLNPMSVRRMRSDFSMDAEVLVATLAQEGQFDAARELAQVYPLKVFPDAVGVSESGRENLIRYGSMAFNALGPRNAIYDASFRDSQEVVDWVIKHCERDALQPGGLGAGIWEIADTGLISDSQAALLVRGLLSAGVDTTIAGIGHTILALTRNPEAWSRVRGDPKLVKFAIDEALRLESPFQMFFRTSSVDSVIGGVRIPADAKILLFLGAANRDPRRWGDDAERFDIDRNASGHVAFGMGLHQCLGQPLARLEIELIVTQLLKHAREIELAGVPRVGLHNVLRAYESIPVSVTAA